MAGRNNTSHVQKVRDRIQASQLINRLETNALADKEIMTAGQVNSARIVLGKVIPDTKAIEVNVDLQGDVKIGWSDTHRVQSETPASDTA